ncbi:MAG: hypothetical protein AB198_01765 [Parcubacteria bacterium C7867-003]|nr:MAG: hypothetical protein AB198_01765 [Parcubacteria bacterium C7867-003]
MKRNIIILIVLVLGLVALMAIFGEKKIDQPTQPTATSTQITSSNGVTLPTSTSSPYHLEHRSDGTVVTVWDYIPAKKVYRLSGKYIKDVQEYEMILSDGPQKYTCDSFVVSTGDSYLIDKYRAMISAGKTINHLDSNNRLVINLDLQTVPLDLKNKITTSSGEITLSVTEKDLGERELGPCANLVEIIDMSK